jgi:hypothetical protein
MDKAIEVAAQLNAFGSNFGVLTMKGYAVDTAVTYDTLQEATSAAAHSGILYNPAKPHHVWFLGKEELSHVGAYESLQAVRDSVGRVHLIMLVTGPLDDDTAHMYALRI